MKRLTRPTVKVDETAAKYMAATGSIPADLRSMNDRLLDLVINGPTLNGVNKDVLRQLIRQLYAALMPYEDTGLEPEEVNRCKLTLMGKSLAEITEFDGVAINRLKELATADKQGRLVVLPCKVGDVLYDRSGKKAEVEEICIGRQDVSALVCFECDYNCDLCAFNSWRTEHSGENSCDGEYGQAAISLTEIGKTVFLTREEAEAKIKETDHAAR